VMLAEIAAGATIAGTFTRSGTRAAPVLWCQERIAERSGPSATPMAIVANAGNANAFTGGRGRAAVEAVMRETGAALGIPAEACFMASTGVIGEPLPAERITGNLAALASALSPDAISDAARAIMTTDTFPKGAAARAEIGGTRVTLMGFAKGSGMIAPDMATMLGYVFTDAAVSKDGLQAMLSATVKRTFNAVTVDGDTSPSDTVLLVATGAAGNAPLTSGRGADGRAFAAALEAVTRDLALQIVRDGEGASKLVEVRVTGARTARDADKVARAIANSPLVKTAMAGEDPNWGRIVMAVGKSGAAADRDLLKIWLGDILVAEDGWVAATYREEDGAAYMKRQELAVTVDLGLGRAETTVWTCDLTHGYIHINADYRS